MKREVIEEEDDEIKAQSPSPLSKEKAVKRVVVGKENEESETGYGILGAFVTTYDVEFGKIRVVRLRFQAHVMVLGINDVIVMFTTMVNKELTFLTSGDN